MHLGLLAALWYLITWAFSYFIVDLTSVNNIHGTFKTVSEESLKFSGSDEETNWMSKAIADIKNPEKGIRLLERISYQVRTLSSFTLDQIVRLVSQLDTCIKREPDSQEATNYLCQEVAALIIKINFHSFENFLQESTEKNFAIQVMIQLVREGKLRPLKAVKDLQRYGIDPRTPEGQQALIEIAKLAAQQDGKGTSQYIKNYGLDAIPLGAALFDMDPADLQGLQNSFSKGDKEAIQTDFLEWWMSLACQCAGRDDLKRLFRENQSLFEKIANLSFDLRTTLTREVIASYPETKGLFLDTLKAELIKEHSLVKKIAVLPRDLRVAVTEVFIRGYQGPYYEAWENCEKGNRGHGPCASCLPHPVPVS